MEKLIVIASMDLNICLAVDHVTHQNEYNRDKLAGSNHAAVARKTKQFQINE